MEEVCRPRRQRPMLGRVKVCWRASRSRLADPICNAPFSSSSPPPSSTHLAVAANVELTLAGVDLALRERARLDLHLGGCGRKRVESQGTKVSARLNSRATLSCIRSCRADAASPSRASAPGSAPYAGRLATPWQRRLSIIIIRPAQPLVCDVRNGRRAHFPPLAGVSSLSLASTVLRRSMPTQARSPPALPRCHPLLAHSTWGARRGDAHLVLVEAVVVESVLREQRQECVPMASNHLTD